MIQYLYSTLKSYDTKWLQVKTGWTNEFWDVGVFFSAIGLIDKG